MSWKALALSLLSRLSLLLLLLLLLLLSLLSLFTITIIIVVIIIIILLQAVITSVWAGSTVVASTFGYTTMRTGAHMADTGTEHNIELIVGVSCSF